MLAANEAFAHEFRSPGSSRARPKVLAVLTCMDSWIEPLKMLGLAPGDGPAND